MMEDQQTPVGPSAKRRRASVYDAVAGRVGYESFLQPRQASRYRDTSSTSQAVPPDELLFRRKGAPVRFEEDDIYRANRHLPPDKPLPDSDLLKVVHAYAADFYSKATKDGGAASFRSMDETALLAMGILLEEAAAGCLGSTGDLAFVEGSDTALVDALPREGMYWANGRWHRKVIDNLTARVPVKRSRSRSMKPGV